MKEGMLTRESVMSKAIHDCFVEMYKKAQPSADYDKILEDVKEGKVEDTNINPIYRRYYLSKEECEYIVNKYIEAYGFKKTWEPNVDMVLEYIKNGGYKDGCELDSNGLPHRIAIKVPKLSSIIGDDNADKVIEVINNCKDYYRFDREETNFSCSAYLGPSPNSNKEYVINYYKEQGIDIEIEDRDPETFWYRDYYGEEWKEYYDEEYETD